MKIILNGIGCPHSGARLVLMELLKTVPDDIELLAVVPKVSKDDLFSTTSANIRFLEMNVKYWSLYLRPVLEIGINLTKLIFKYDAVINVSNYGLCLTKNQVLYIHNQFIVDISAKEKIGGGYPNKINRFLLNTYLKKASAIFVQSNHIQKMLKNYCNHFRITHPKNVNVITPLPMIEGFSNLNKIEKNFEFQFFYPASEFVHKRIDLATDSILAYNKANQSAGLIITAKGENDLKNNLIFLGSISHTESLERMNSSDAIIFTSEREALGLPLLEALYFEKPAILPNLPYATEIYGD
ncbi:MAG: glycosyltransferase, partial [Ignavibacteria bacterium]|nr:glycosyltransferase [Ignavibacteria bacterium]